MTVTLPVIGGAAASMVALGIVVSACGRQTRCFEWPIAPILTVTGFIRIVTADGLRQIENGSLMRHAKS